MRHPYDYQLPRRKKFRVDPERWVFDAGYNERLTALVHQRSWRLGNSLARYEERVVLAIVAGERVPQGCLAVARGKICGDIVSGCHTWARPTLRGRRQLPTIEELAGLVG